MGKLKRIFLSAVLFAAGASVAQATAYYDYARVIKAKPVYRYVTIAQPVEQCYPVRRHTRYQAQHDRTGSTIVGAVIGGAIGHAIGDNRASTVAGAIIGGSLGHSSSPAYHSSRVMHKCEVVYEKTRKVREIKGYKVKYRYNGEVYRTFSETHPGNKIKVRVKVSPAGYY